MNIDQHYCLRWHNFQTNVVSELESFRNDENFVDVTLTCGGKQIKAHKLILSASSPYFKQIFQDNPCKHPVVLLQDVDYNILRLILEYVYTGAVNVSEKLMSSLLHTADMLHIRGLTETSSTSVPVPSATAEKSRKNPLDSNDEEAASPAKKLFRKPIFCDEERVTNFNESKNGMEGPNPEENKIPIFSAELLSDGNRSESQPSNPVELQGSTESMEGPSNIFNFPGEIIADVTQNGAEQSRSHSLDPRPCPVCGHVYSNLSNLRQHIRLIHNPECVTCPLCSKTFKNKLYLKRHLISFHEIVPPSHDQDRAKTAMYSNLMNNATLSTDHSVTPVDPRSYSHVMSTQTMSPRRRHDEINNMLFAHQKNLMTPQNQNQKNSYFNQNLEEKLDAATTIDTNSNNCFGQFQQYHSVIDKSMMNNNHDSLAQQNKLSILSHGKHQYMNNPVTSSNNPSNEIRN